LHCKNVGALFVTFLHFTKSRFQVPPKHSLHQICRIPNHNLHDVDAWHHPYLLFFVAPVLPLLW
jgi:hypothetical protein